MSRLVVVLGAAPDVDLRSAVRDARAGRDGLLIINLGSQPTRDQQDAIDPLLAEAGTGLAYIEATVALSVEDAASKIEPEDLVILALSPSEEAAFAAAMRRPRS